MDRWKGKSVPFSDVQITDGYWKEAQSLFQKVTIDAVYNRFEETGRFEAMKFTWKEGMPHKPHIFWESDVTKWIEGASYFLQNHPDAQLEAKIDKLVEYMSATQDESGYLNAYFTVVEPDARFSRRTDHELYCAGHLIEGAIAYANATGKRAMLDVARKYADLIDRVFRTEHAAAFDTPGHQEIEPALLKLYKHTGEVRYKELAEYFINTRGTSARDTTYTFTDQAHMQSHLPVREQVTAEGHSVRALYMYRAMADMALMNRDEELYHVCQRLFTNITNKRMYITGGVGSTDRGESFTFDYDLPEYTAYAETCASIALALFCREMLRIEPNGIYADCAERAIYNTVMAGVSLSGDSFFYENPLAVNPHRNAFNDAAVDGLKEHLPILERAKVFNCSCCPPNLLRLVGEISSFMYSTGDDTIYANCYMSADAKLSLNENVVELTQKTAYPYDGMVYLEVKTNAAFTLALHIPQWASSYRMIINDEEVTGSYDAGYAYVHRSWRTGDMVILQLQMDIKIIEANPEVRDLCGRVAITRGPIVYCAEGIDQPDISLRDIRISKQSSYTPGELTIGGRKLPTIAARAEVRGKSDKLYSEKTLPIREIDLTLIPYFAWANRGITEMTTWILSKD